MLREYMALHTTYPLHLTIQILSLTTLTKQGHVVRIRGPTSGIFVAGRRGIFIPPFRDDHRGYYVLPIKAPSLRAAGLKPDITFDRARSLRASTLDRCSNLRLVVSR
jgi:hypothetical protein